MFISSSAFRFLSFHRFRGQTILDDVECCFAKMIVFYQAGEMVLSATVVLSPEKDLLFGIIEL